MKTKLLQIAGRTDIPIAVGIPTSPHSPQEPQDEWVRDYSLDCYPGTLFYNGVRAIYLAFTEEFLVMEDLGICVTDDGFTKIDPKAKTIRGGRRLEKP